MAIYIPKKFFFLKFRKKVKKTLNKNVDFAEYIYRANWGLKKHKMKKGGSEDENYRRKNQTCRTRR